MWAGDSNGNTSHQNGVVDNIKSGKHHDGEPYLIHDLSRKPVWCVRNREDYHPVIHHVYDVKFSPTTDDIIVAEGFWPYSRLQVFDHSGRSVHKFTQGKLLPFGITFNKHSHIVITDHKDRTVKFYTRYGQFVNSWNESMFEWPNGIAINKHGNYCVADWSKGKVSLHDENGTAIRSFNTYGDGISEFSCPEYITVDSFNRIIMTDAYDHCVKVFDELGRLLLLFGQEEGPGHICDPRGVCVDTQGNICVADWADSKIQLYSPAGKWISTLLSKENELDHPWGIDITSAGLVCTEHKRISGPTIKLYETER